MSLIIRGKAIKVLNDERDRTIDRLYKLCLEQRRRLNEQSKLINDAIKTVQVLQNNCEIWKDAFERQKIEFDKLAGMYTEKQIEDIRDLIIWQ